MADLHICFAESSTGRLSAKSYLSTYFFTERPLPRVTLGKPFTESKPAFAECSGHSTTFSINSLIHRDEPIVRKVRSFVEFFYIFFLQFYENK
jgi:hypothetical protein